MRHVFDPWAGKIPWRRTWQPTPVFLPGKSHGQRSLAGYRPGDYKSQTQLSNKTTYTHTHTEEFPDSPMVKTLHVQCKGPEPMHGS